MDEMTWTDPQLKARHEENSRKLERLREMMMANVLEEHLRDIETRTRERQAQIMDQLMESRHLLNRTDCLKAAPQLTDLDRLNGMNEAQSESMSMAIHEVVESF